jgi:4-hydroxy-tetrahydrodipicolinate synthase
MQTKSLQNNEPFRDFSGLWIPLITPFRAGQVDHPALARLVRHYAGCGIAGFVPCGSTGEAAALEDAEQVALLETVLAACNGLPVMMGLSGYNLNHCLSWVKTLSAYPIAGLLVPAPHYIRPSQAGLLHWFRALADAAHVPLVVYDIPARTGATMALETMLALAEHPNIGAVKDCGGDAAKTRALIADGRLQILAGDDVNIFSTLAQGGVGAIAACAHLRTTEFAEVIALLREGQLAQAQQKWAPLPQHISTMFAEPNPTSIKAALAAQGWIHNELRAPMMPTSIAASLT